MTDRLLLRAALILNDVYRSVDIVHLLLAEHDRRAGGALAPRYLEVLRTAPNVVTEVLTQRSQP